MLFVKILEKAAQGGGVDEADIGKNVISVPPIDFQKRVLEHRQAENFPVNTDK
jgi:hypothetical protein